MNMKINSGVQGLAPSKTQLTMLTRPATNQKYCLCSAYMIIMLYRQKRNNNSFQMRKQCFFMGYLCKSNDVNSILQITITQTYSYAIIIIMNKTHKDLIMGLIHEGIIKNLEVGKVMELVDRKYYAPKYPYEDCPQSIRYGATISAPHMHAYALQLLFHKLKTAKYVLDVGSGTGYLTAAMALIVPTESKVFGVQHVPQLVKKSRQNIKGSNADLLQKIRIEEGDGRLGWVLDKSIQFDVIHVGAAAQKMPLALLDQLAETGKMIIPLGGQHQVQKFLQIAKNNGKIQQKIILSVRYVPLTDLSKQLQ